MPRFFLTRRFHPTSQEPGGVSPRSGTTTMQEPDSVMPRSGTTTMQEPGGVLPRSGTTTIAVGAARNEQTHGSPPDCAAPRRRCHNLRVAICRCTFSILAAFSALLFATGCSTALFQGGKHVDQFRGVDPKQKDIQRIYTRAQVLEKFGQPIATKDFSPPISVAQAKKLGLLQERDLRFGSPKEMAAFRSTDGRIAHVDEFRIKGPTATQGDVMAAGLTLGFGAFTLGASEVVFFPMALNAYLGRLNDVTELYLFYDRAGLVLGQTRPQKSNRKTQAPSRLR